MMKGATGVGVISRSYIPGLNGMRAGAVLMVIIGHAGFPYFIPGGLGVTIFFFISGFLITSLLLQESDASGTISISHFYIRRFLRLGPELLALLLFSSVLGLLYNGAEGRLPQMSDWVGALTYSTNYLHLFLFDGGDGMRWPHLWSLAVEEHFYLTFPLLFLLVSRRPVIAITILSAVCVWGLAWRFVVLHGGFPMNWYYEASDTRIDSIAYGCLTACLFAWSAPRFNLSTLAGTASLAAGVVLMLASLLIRDEAFRETARFTVQGLSMALFTAGLYTSPLGSKILDLLEWTPMRWMGQMSYGAYLWHFDVIVASSHFTGISPLDRPLGQRVAFAIACAAISFSIAYVSYRALYTPFVGLRRHFGSHSKQDPTRSMAPQAPGSTSFHSTSMNTVLASDSSVADSPSCGAERRTI